jgi:dihydroorotate dehydrogenase electron transfer subunit
MEKRMACGIGVCFSCVCQTIVNGEKHNSRVCIDGPIIESKQINWNE